ncbi:hypothetical protein GSI_05628 [Ganoderma sinense ZZ0214-1]|uniref:DUF6534 domain-containing protein n=1 Tax=Ganoderma sinense ZZ0214-1 TaxID=1077348 RepID=A0A2G8SF42_9APHY|nr:hypothetical protein GSI_05628 [Ganoderma sinense ZZ0214-1]
MAPVMPPSPLPHVDSVPPIDNTFGAILIATFLAIALYGLVVHQCYQYFQQYPKDSVWIKSLSVRDFSHCAQYTHLLLSVTTGIVAVPSQIFFARRIFCLGSQRYRILVVMALILLAGEFGLLCAGTVETFIFKAFAEFESHSHTWLIPAGAGMGVVADGFITAVLVNLLRSKHIGVKRMDHLLNTLILYTINTGLLTGTLDLLSFVFGVVYPQNLIYAGFGIVTAKSYANSLLAALNTRNALRYGPNCALTISAAGPNTPGPLAAPRQEATDMSEVTQVEAQDAGVMSQKIEVSENSQARLTLELVGLAV